MRRRMTLSSQTGATCPEGQGGGWGGRHGAWGEGSGAWGGGGGGEGGGVACGELRRVKGSLLMKLELLAP